MTYRKPDVTVLGDARALIEKINGFKQSTVAEGGSNQPSKTPPAYDLDE
jgi:hypothetical protein